MRIGVEGLIGVGKSTFSTILSRILCALLFLEPVDTNEWLERFYGNPKKFAFLMQKWCFDSRTLFHQKADEHPGNSVLDRSLYGDWVFAMLNHDLKNMDDAQYAAYEANRAETMKCLKPLDLIVFLRATPEECMERIRERGRGCESGITLDYLRGLERCYDIMLGWVRENHPETKIIELRWTSEFEKNTSDAIRVLQSEMARASPGNESPLNSSANDEKRYEREDIEVFE